MLCGVQADGLCEVDLLFLPIKGSSVDNPALAFDTQNGLAPS